MCLTGEQLARSMPSCMTHRTAVDPPGDGNGVTHRLGLPTLSWI